MFLHTSPENEELSKKGHGVLGRLVIAVEYAPWLLAACVMHGPRLPSLAFSARWNIGNIGVLHVKYKIPRKINIPVGRQQTVCTPSVSSRQYSW